MGGWKWNFGTSKSKAATPPTPKSSKPAAPSEPVAAEKGEIKTREERVTEPETAAIEKVH